MSVGPTTATLLQEVGDRAAEFGGRFAAAMVLLALFVALARFGRPLVRRWLDRRNRPSYTRVFLGVYTLSTWIVGFLLAATLAFPSVKMVDLLASLGILSVAAGFAFRGILENLLAGVLLILQDPFKSGDQIAVGEFEGVVEGITVRETLVRAYDGRLVMLPNAHVHTHPLVVTPSDQLLRSVFTVHLDAGSDLERARKAAASALASVAGIASDPPPDTLIAEATADAVILECRLWTAPQRAVVTSARDQAIDAVLAALREDGISAPVDTLRVDLGSGS